MSRTMTLAAARRGPIPRDENRASVVRRLVAMMRQAKAMGADVVAYPEATLTACFPHWFTEDEVEVDSWFERATPGPDTEPLLDEVRRPCLTQGRRQRYTRRVRVRQRPDCRPHRRSSAG